MTIAAGVIVGLVAAFSAGQGTMLGPNQRYWIVGAWLIGVPLSAVLLSVGVCALIAGS